LTFCQFGISTPLSTLWHFTGQLLFVVAKVIYSVSVLLAMASTLARHLPLLVLPFISAITSFASPVLPSFLRFLPPAIGITFQPMYKPCCSETRYPSSNTEFPNQHLSQKLVPPAVSFPPLSSFSNLGLLSETTNLNLYRRSRHFTCPPFLSRFGAVKPSLRFFVSSLSVDLDFSWSPFAFQFLFR
jgi:hypothetical protein